MKPEEIISDEEILRVHGYAKFGTMPPREVVNDGVRKYAVGFSGGHTQLTILLEHGLIRKPKPGKYNADLTEKGKRYARSIWNTRAPITAQDALAVPKIAALRQQLSEALTKVENDRTLWTAEWHMWAVDARAALAGLGEAG